jgi:hypothetical protein
MAGFGNAVALSSDGSTVAIGAFLDNKNGLQSGSAYVYDVSDTILSEAVRLSPDDSAPGDWFGSTLALNQYGSVLAVAARGADRFTGKVYVFAWSDGAWIQETMLTAPFSPSNPVAAFGHSIAMLPDGNEIWVGSPMYGETGAVFGFVRQGSDWMLEAVLQPDNSDDRVRFGSAVAVSPEGQWLSIGATDPAIRESTVHVYQRTNTGWHKQAELRPGERLQTAWFGSSVSMSNHAGFIVVGARDESSSDFLTGAVFVYARADTTWNLVQVLRPSQPLREMRFGHVVAMNSAGTDVLVGARTEARIAFDAGAVYSFGSASLPVSISDQNRTLDSKLEIDISPHPVSGHARLKVVIPSTGEVVINVFDLLGRPVGTLFDGVILEGHERELNWTTGSLPTGQYILVISGRSFQESRNIVLIR